MRLKPWDATGHRGITAPLNKRTPTIFGWFLEINNRTPKFSESENLKKITASLRNSAREAREKNRGFRVLYRGKSTILVPFWRDFWKNKRTPFLDRFFRKNKRTPKFSEFEISHENNRTPLKCWDTDPRIRPLSASFGFFPTSHQLSSTQKYIYTRPIQKNLDVLKSYESESFISAV